MHYERMKILQIDDKEEYKIECADSFENLEDAKEKILSNNYNFFIIDGNFPIKKGKQPDINAKAAIDLIKSTDTKGKVIIWTNSMRAQKYASDNNIKCFSKKQQTEQHIKRMEKSGLKEYAEIKDKQGIIDELK
jgi:hypothetical protein